MNQERDDNQNLKRLYEVQIDYEYENKKHHGEY